MKLGFETPVRFIPGVGPRLAELLREKRILTACDLLYFFPFRYIDRSRLDKVRTLSPGQKTVVGQVFGSGLVFFRNRRRLFEVILGDETGTVSLKWFHFYPEMQSRFKKGTVLMVSGEVSRYRGQCQFVHPEVQVLNPDLAAEVNAPGMIPVYSEIPGLGQKRLRKITLDCLARICLDEILPEEILSRYRFPEKRRALREIHSPPAAAELDDWNRAASPAHRREIFEEFFLMELALALKRRGAKREEGVPFQWSASLVRGWLQQLPFQLTHAQKRVLHEILKDMSDPTPMNRLIQGDVGSGKTVVALLTALVAIQNGKQAAIMAPTEILAEQHFRTAGQFLAPFKISIGLLTGSMTAAEKSRIRSRLRRGIYQMVIGTHAVISDGVGFQNLGLAVIDEQHRFGVLQRQALRSKGEVPPDLLIMTATPIPRTLAMTVYGDLDVSIIDEMPPGRQPVRTDIIESRDRGRLYQIISRTLDRGEQGYIVYPLVEESERLVLKDAERMCQELKKVFPTRKLALLHGRVKGEERERVFRDFKAGHIGLLVCTTVIEVGVDVPNATLMVIEHADRFGLSQLHQLRGRVGRGRQASGCLLISDSLKSEAAYKRLNVMCETGDGFRIAEEDLKLRGPGDFLGTRQAGLPEFRIANILRDQKILIQAREEAFRLVERDPDLVQSPLLKGELMLRWKERLALAEIG
ncbi:MAG: ATP-dependent DNA helicase RecG [Deltaproteobacteria bacterium]|nr:ATP-dependent DNA helicase RecG [Deltaproteobacteria bacterium]